MDPLLTLAEVAQTLHVSPRTTKRLVASGEIDSVLIGRLRRVRPAAVEAYLERQAASAQPAPDPAPTPVPAAEDPLQRTIRSPHRRARATLAG